MILGIIPARGGSKGVYKKNIRECDGVPLICYTFEAALRSQLIDRVVLSTDSEEIAQLGKANGVEVPFLRPQELAQDGSLVIDTIRHAMDHYDKLDIDAIVLLQPTSPLRTSMHIDDCIFRLWEHKVETVISVVKVPHLFVNHTFNMDGEGILDAVTEAVPLITDRSKKPVKYARNGPAVLVSRSEVIRRGDLYGLSIMGYKMKEQESIDIDTMYDFRIAEMLLKDRRTGNDLY